MPSGPSPVTLGCWIYPLRISCVALRIFGKSDNRCMTPPLKTMRSGDTMQMRFAQSDPIIHATSDHTSASSGKSLSCSTGTPARSDIALEQHCPCDGDPNACVCGSVSHCLCVCASASLCHCEGVCVPPCVSVCALPVHLSVPGVPMPGVPTTPVAVPVPVVPTIHTAFQAHIIINVTTRTQPSIPTVSGTLASGTDHNLFDRRRQSLWLFTYRRCHRCDHAKSLIEWRLNSLRTQHRNPRRGNVRVCRVCLGKLTTLVSLVSLVTLVCLVSLCGPARLR